MKELVKSNWISLSMIGIVLIWALFQIPSLPSELPIHFDINGIPDRYAPLGVALWILPFVNVVVLAVVFTLTKRAPEGFQMPNSQKTVSVLNLGITFFLMTLYVGMVLDGKESGNDYALKLLVPAFGVLMMFMGNYFGKLERNFYVGIRLPWTLASEENWKRTHRFSGKLFVVAGVLIILGMFLSSPLHFLVIVLVGSIVSSFLYSLFYYLRVERRQRVNDAG